MRYKLLRAAYHMLLEQYDSLYTSYADGVTPEEVFFRCVEKLNRRIVRIRERLM